MTQVLSNSRRSPRMEIHPGVWLDSRLGLYLADARILVVADLHWGYATSHRAHGNLLPAWGDEEIAQRLHGLLIDYQPDEMIWLGDSLHTLAGAEAAEVFLRGLKTPVTVVSGNHDARWVRAKNCPFVNRAGYLLHHGDQEKETGEASREIVGHFHPAVSWQDGAGTRLKLPALVATARRLVLPAFSPWAAGVTWNPCSPGETLYAISSKRIFTLPHTRTQKEAETK